MLPFCMPVINAVGSPLIKVLTPCSLLANCTVKSAFSASPDSVSIWPLLTTIWRARPSSVPIWIRNWRSWINSTNFGLVRANCFIRRAKPATSKSSGSVLTSTSGNFTTGIEGIFMTFKPIVIVGKLMNYPTISCVFWSKALYNNDEQSKKKMAPWAIFFKGWNSID